MSPSEWDSEEPGPTLTELFDLDDPSLDELQQKIHAYLSQETRHHILQLVLGHPHHLVSVTEFTYYIDKNPATIRHQLANLATHHIVQQYHHEPNESVRNLPAGFWGFTELGVELLEEFRYLRGLPIMRAVHDATAKSETVERHEAAPRPALPSSVAESLDYPEPDSEVGPLSIDELPRPIYADSVPDDLSTLQDESEGGRTLDELF